MIDSYEDYEKFLELNCRDDLFLHIVFSDDREHYCVSTPSIIFVKNIRTKDLYHIIFDHQDSPKIIELTQFITDIKKFLGRIFVLDKKSTIQHIPLGNKLVDINLGVYLNNKKLIDIHEYETSAHKFVYQNYHGYQFVNRVIPLVKHREMVDKAFFNIDKLKSDHIFECECFLRINNEIIKSLAELEKNGICVDVSKFKSRFSVANCYGKYVYSKYNLFTSTGRPSNSFAGVNYAALNKEDGSRNCFVSRFGDNGSMMMVDYSAFHPRIICEIINFKLGYDIDFYKYIAELCFKKDDVDQQDIKDAKILTFKQLYGDIDDEYLHIQFFYNLKKFIVNEWNFFKKNGYILTPVFGRKITSEQIQNPTPNKLFNYILQATETEISVPILRKINNFLRDKKSKAVLYTYDSILFDIFNIELDVIKKDIISIMTEKNRFPVKCYIGDSYGEMKQILF